MSEPDLHKIQGIGLLKELSESELVTLSRVCSWQRYAANEQIIDRQSETNDVFFIIEGKVRVVNYSLSGRVITLDDIIAGGHFGELAAIDEKTRSASVMALMPCFLAVISQGCFIDLVKALISLTSKSGCSRAAKCPPFFIFVQRFKLNILFI